MKKKTTIYDVARESGVSLATVSRVINGSSVVKAKTKEKVLAVIKELDFKPNEVARGLATSKTTTIAIVFPQSLFAHVKDMIGGIGDTGRHLDYNINMYTTDDIGDDDTVSDVTERIIKSRVDGVILFNNEHIDQMIEGIDRYHLPIVVIGKQISNETMGSIYIDVKNAAKELIMPYIEKGKTDILYVSPKQNLIKNDDVIEGIQEAYHENGLVFDENNIISSTSSYEFNLATFEKYFKNKKHDVIFCGYDKDGVAVIQSAIENGIDIPGEMDVVGMLNTSYAVMCRPQLSSLNVPIYDMGALAVRLLTKFLQGEAIESKEIAVRYMFIERESSHQN
ncbi:LacI family DNA-binding transcriptional regulator [Tannockella kyphosi]|uniref:LacI family DNA-binding transcriptional regulator n=1 Tax=Tannockella kyphosi TaxID=2899121 RepID=UPI00201331A6|nr:LacI family DNA-binding transcriptional regulator [Tannockella kyphosi]